MSISFAIPTGVKIVGGALAGGVVLGGAGGAALALRSDSPKSDGITGHEKRMLASDTIIGAGVGAGVGVGFAGLRKAVPALANIPVLGTAKALPLALIGASLLGAGVAAAETGYRFFD